MQFQKIRSRVLYFLFCILLASPFAYRAYRLRMALNQQTSYLEEKSSEKISKRDFVAYLMIERFSTLRRTEEMLVQKVKQNFNDNFRGVSYAKIIQTTALLFGEQLHKN